MRSATKAMMVMNRKMNLPVLQKIMMEFQKQSESMEMKQEIVADAIDDALEGESDEEEQEAVVGQVLDELGISLNDELGSAVKPKAKEVEEEDAKDKELEARLANLRK